MKDYVIEFQGLMKSDELVIKEEYQFYYRRGCKFFLRNKQGHKIVFEGESMPEELKQMKKGNWYYCEFSG
jgi:hypothetical protein